MTRSDARKKALAAKRTQAEQAPTDILAEALHARIDGDWLLGGGGWGPDGWVDDIPHDKARISDLVRWVVNAVEGAGLVVVPSVPEVVVVEEPSCPRWAVCKHLLMHCAKQRIGCNGREEVDG